MVASATILFYDYLLTLADEVSQEAISIALHSVYCHGNRSNTFGMGGKRGVRGEHDLLYVTH